LVKLTSKLITRRILMAVIIGDTCINCGACIDECPVEAIVDEDDNPTGEETYYVYGNKCVECVGHHDEPACATACPTEGCITWDAVGDSPSHRDDITDDMRGIGKAVVA
jgi:ferredoxin